MKVSVVVVVVVVVAVLAAACGSKSVPSDCVAAITRGIDAASKARMADQARAEQSASRYKEALTERCKADQWPSEVVSCIASATTMPDVQACQARLTPEQRARVTEELREEDQEETTTFRSDPEQRMPANAPRHPPTPDRASELMASFENYVNAVCACTDIACVSREGEDYARANAPPQRNPDPELAKKLVEDPKFEELSKKLVDCVTKLVAASSADTAAPAGDTPAPGSNGK